MENIVNYEINETIRGKKNKFLLTESTNSIFHITRLIIQRYIDVLIIKLIINVNLSLF